MLNSSVARPGRARRSASRRCSVVARYPFCPGYFTVRYIARAPDNLLGSLTRAVHFPRFGFTRAFASTGLPLLLRDTCATIRALAARAIVPDTVNVDPDRRARVILNRADGSGSSVRTGGLVSSTFGAVILLASTLIEAAFA